MNVFPVLIGGERFDALAQADDNPQWIRALEQQHRRHTSFCLCTASGELPLVIRLYGRVGQQRRYGLARLRDTGLNHDPDCRFFGEGLPAGEDNDTLPAFEVQDDGTTRAHLAFSLKLTEPIEKAGSPKPAGGGIRTARGRASEAALLYRLWRAARLNVYRGRTRTWFTVSYALLQSAGQFIVDRTGATLADHLLIATGANDRMVDEHNAAVLARLQDQPGRAVLIGRMRSNASERRKQLLPLVEFAGMPKALIESSTIEAMLARRPLVKKLLSDRSGNVIVLACIEPDGGAWWKVLQLAVLPTSPRFIPVESSYEIEFEDYLIGQQRQFIKPIVVDELGENDQRPDYILLDTVPRVRCEVWGMQTAEYLDGKAARLADYEKKGQVLVSWSANPRDPFPALPPATPTTAKE